MINFISFGNNHMLQIITFWSLSKILIIKSCEQRLAKTFILPHQIFVEHLKVNWNPHDFFCGIYKNGLGSK